MNTILWIVQGFLTMVFAYSGIMKSTQSERKLVSIGQTGVEHLPLPLIRSIGIAELLGVAGLMLPSITGLWPALTPIAAGCLGLIMIPAGIIHYRRGEYKTVWQINAFVLVLCGLVVWGRASGF